MTIDSNIRNIKRSQKESLLLQKISQLFMQTAMDDNRLMGITISRVQLSDDKGLCRIFFYTSQGKEEFSKILPILILYKPSLRKALSSEIKSRYTPELLFAFDDSFEKTMRLEGILEKVKQEEAKKVNKTD